MAAHWTFDQGSGTSATDSVGSNPGTLTNMDPGTAWVDGKSGKALDFDGVDDFVEYPANIEFNDGDFTVAGWFRREGVSGGSQDVFAVFSQRGDVAANGTPTVNLLGQYTGVAGIQIRDNVGALVEIKGTTAIENDVWYHVAGVKTDAALKIYVNGQLEKTVSHSLSGDFDAGAVHRHIGRHAANGGTLSFSNGLIDDVRVYTRALSDEDMISLYNTTAGLYPGCAAPDGDAGVVRYDPGLKVLVFCDGRDWVQMGDASQSGTPSDLGTVVPDGLIAYWKFDQTSGTTAPGTPGSNGTLTNMDNNDWVDGKFGKALSFDGVDDFVSYPTNIEFGNNDFTVAGWFKREGDSGGPENNFLIFLQRADATGDGNPTIALVGRGGSGTAGVQIRDNVGSLVTLFGPTIINDHQWYHVAAIKTGTMLRLYLNGILEASVPHTLTGNFHAGAIHRYIGKHIYGSTDVSFSNGLIDDVRIYNRALDDAEVQQLYYASGPGCANPDGDAGTLIYNSTYKVLQYCNSVEWVALSHGGAGVYTPTGSGDPNDSSPDSFNFADVSGAAFNTVTTSAAITPAGYLAAANVTVTGDGSPEISINGGPWVTSGTISPGQSIAVRLTSAANTTPRSATVTIGGVSDIWTVSTVAADTTPNAFTFTDQTGVAFNTQITSNSVTISGINTATPVSVSGAGGTPQIRINGGSWVTSGTITDGQTLEVRMTSANTFSGARSATIDVGGVTDTWSITTLAADTTPNAFTFTDVTDAALSTLTTSSPITISGINTSTPVSVTGTGAEIRINGGTWGTSGNITNGQTLEVRLTSSASLGTAMTATVTVGGVSDAWSVTTIGPDTTPNAFNFTDVTGANISTLTTSNSLTISGINTSTPVSVSGAGAQISINGGAWVTSGNITNGQTLAVRMTSSSSFATAVTATVTVGTISDTWSVTTSGADTTPDAFNFTDVTGQAVNTVITSNTITISGISTGVAVSVSGSGSPKISINGGAWVTSGTITNGQSLRVQLTSSASYSTAMTATVNVSGLSDVWSVTTQAPPLTVINITGSNANVNLFTKAGSPTTAGNWEFIIASGATVYATATGTAALVTGSFPAGSTIKITNNGTIYGKGGNGGAGGAPGAAGAAGGPAISLGFNVTIDNTNGYIYGGGGGGGGGGRGYNAYSAGGGGGGGRSGASSSAGGAGQSTLQGNGQNGGAGTVSAPGAGGAGATYGGHTGGTGGTGGQYGMAGNAGSPGTTHITTIQGGAGGAAGKAINLNSRTITWLGGNNATRVKGAVN